mmetsp:Transcript_48419/g.122129  ORF Transcript_48419/g.122129 Transcript_48419/m.122129 type:complete len:239 (+) Transcript_48419:1204-1920(+)
MTVHGMVPKMPCMIITQKVGILKKRKRLPISEATAAQPPCPLDALSHTSARGGSCMKAVTKTDTTTETKPTMTKATRQPWKPMTISVAIGTTVMVVTNMPRSKADWIRPKIFPRFESPVRSATMPFEIGLSAASNAPFSARKNTIGKMSVTKANKIVTTPWPKAPTSNIVRRFKMPRSAKIPQKGAAKFASTICETVMYEMSMSAMPMSSCRAFMEAPSSCVSAPSREATAQSNPCNK